MWCGVTRLGLQSSLAWLGMADIGRRVCARLSMMEGAATWGGRGQCRWGKEGGRGDGGTQRRTHGGGWAVSSIAAHGKGD